MVTRERFAAVAADIGLETVAERYEAFAAYSALLLDWNNRMNLTAITDDEGIAIKHFADSLLTLRQYPFPEGARVIDVGAGAGFPSVPLLIARGDLRVTLLDSLNKRLTFLQALCGELGLAAETVHARAEEAGRQPRFRGAFDVALARAVAPLNLLAEYCLPLLCTGGALLALKGPDCDDEVAAAKSAVELCGGAVEAVKRYSLPNGDARALVVVRKTAPTPAKYPRPSAQIAKRPL